VFQNRVLRRIFGPKEEDVTDNGEDYVTRSFMICILIKRISADQFKKNEMGNACGMYGGQESFRILVVKLEGKRPLGRPRRRWEDNIKMQLHEVVWGRDWIDLAEDRDKWWALVKA
jgi:hypothetical protein